MVRKYTGNSDGLSKTGKAAPGLVKFFELCKDEYGFSNLGMFVNRRMNNDAAKKDPNNPKYLSVHATGRAVDMGYKNRKTALKCWDFLIANTKELGIEEIHDYAFDPDGKGARRPWGRGYRCSRGEGMKGVVVFDEKRNAGTPGGRWLHVEISPEMAKNPAKMQAAWDKAKGKPAPAPAAPAATPKVTPTPPPAPAPAPAAPQSPPFPGHLDVGSKGEHVKMVQRVVGATPDGDFGPATGKRVSAWRLKHGLGIGTKVGPKTWKRMFG